MEQVLIDTDVLIDFLRGYNRRIKPLFEQIETKTIQAYVSLISVTELYAGEDVTYEPKREALHKLLSYLTVVNLDIAIAKRTGNLKRIHVLALADAYIAATCIEKKLQLATFNHKHFAKIPNLRLYTIHYPPPGWVG